jgi:hypothetical protein
MPRVSLGDNNNFVFFSLAQGSSRRMMTNHLNARVVKWQTRTFEGRMPKGMGVQVPPRAPLFHVEKAYTGSNQRSFLANCRSLVFPRHTTTAPSHRSAHIITTSGANGFVRQINCPGLLERLQNGDLAILSQASSSNVPVKTKCRTIESSAWPMARMRAKPPLLQVSASKESLQRLDLP